MSDNEQLSGSGPESTPEEDCLEPTNRDGRNSRRRLPGNLNKLNKSPFRRRILKSTGDSKFKSALNTSTPTIDEVTEDSSSEKALEDSYPGHPRIQSKDDGDSSLVGSVSEYTSLLPYGRRTKYGTRTYSGRSGRGSILSDSCGDNISEASCCSASDELSSNSSSASSMTSRQYLTFSMIMASALSSSFTVCLFPPFYPRIAEMKGATATEYGLIIGTNCLMAFIVTPFIGNHLGSIGVKFAFVGGLFGGGVCCSLSGFLEFFEPGSIFVLVSVLIRVLHAICNALVITSSFTYTACEFPSSVASIFSITRCVMNVAQLAGPIVGGLIYEAGGFVAPFVIFGGCQMVLAFFTFVTMSSPELDDDDDDDCDTQIKPKKKKNKASVTAMLCIPTVWFSFAAFIVATVCNGFLSINLEPQVLRTFNLTPFYIGVFFGIKDGANSLASPLWGWMCDRNKTSVKPYLIVSSVLVAASFFIMGASDMLGFGIKLTLPLLFTALCLNGAGIGGQQVSGVVDAMHEAAAAGYPDNPTTNGLVAGLWSSLSGAGRFISRGASGILVDQFGFSAVASIVCGLQMVIALSTFLYLVTCECSLVSRDNRLRSQSVTIVEQGRRRDERVVFTTNSSPSESLMNRSIHVCIPNNCGGSRMVSRIANSMPPKRWSNYNDETMQNESRSVR